jgi:Tfp pilus assembly protein PilF
MIEVSMEHYARAIELQPNHAQAYNNLGILLHQKGKVNEAIQTFQAGLSQVPDDVDLHYNLAIVLDLQGRRNEAREELRRALQTDPDSSKVKKFLQNIE